MKKWLLEISFGPVQSFIESARKSRDLSAGSFILSEIVRSAAKKLLENDGELIYPVEERVVASNPGKPGTSNLSNILLAQYTEKDNLSISALAQEVIEAARNQLLDMGKKTVLRFKNSDITLREEIFTTQIKDILEIYAAWSELKDYDPSYKALKQTLIARKNIRDFQPMFSDGESSKYFGIPKSSFDGLRESVLPERSLKNNKARALFSIKEGEQLDAIAAIKRWVALEKGENFLPLSRIAVQGWLMELKEKMPENFKKLDEIYSTLVREGVASSIKINGIKDFLYDGALLFQEELANAILEAESNKKAQTELLKLRDLFREIASKIGNPCPYAAMIMADGDKMGAFVDKATSRNQHSTISAAIAQFADKAMDIAGDYQGQAIYAGGEDLLLIAPLSGVIEMAQQLSKNFATKVSYAAQTLGKKDLDNKELDIPTLRVGVAIAHYLEPYSLIREYAKAAESYAKGESGTENQGNALGLVLHIRAGHIIKKRLSFASQEDFQNIKNSIEYYKSGKIPGKFAYRLKQAAEQLQQLSLNGEAVTAELNLILARSQSSGDAEKLSSHLKKEMVDRLSKIANGAEASPNNLRELADELILARWLSARNASEVM